MLDNTYYQYDKMLFSQLAEVPRHTFVSQNNLAVPGYADDAPTRVNCVDERTAIKLLRYYVSYYLNWDAEDAMESLSFEVLSKGKLLKSVVPRINIPSEIKNNSGLVCYYLVCRMFPESYTYDKELAIENFYEIVLAHKPIMAIHYFEDNADGIERSLLALRHAVMNEPAGMDIRQMYAFLSTPAGETWLRRHRLLRASQKYFDNAVEFLHAALTPEMDDASAYLESSKEFSVRQKSGDTL